MFLNTRTRLGVLPHLRENLLLSPSRVNLHNDSGKTGMFKRKASLDQDAPKRIEDEALVSFYTHRGDGKKVPYAASKQISRKRSSLYLLH